MKDFGLEKMSEATNYFKPQANNVDGRGTRGRKDQHCKFHEKYKVITKALSLRDPPLSPYCCVHNRAAQS